MTTTLLAVVVIMAAGITTRFKKRNSFPPKR